MRVAFYNQMFALNGQSFISNIIGHWTVHFQNNQKRIWKRTNLDKTIETIGKSKADIVAIAEVLEGQETELKEKLKEKGYGYVFFQNGNRTKLRKRYVKVAVASKFKCRKIKIFDFPIQNKIGNGGGIIHCYFPGLMLNLINIHLGRAKRRANRKQIKFLKSYVKKNNGKLILIGDFNLRYNKMKDSFSGLELVSDEIKTCSLTPVFNRFSYKDLDHILVRGLKKCNFGGLRGYSDHKLIYADLE